MWLYVGLVALVWALGWYLRDRQTLASVQDKHVFITGCDSGFGHMLAKRLDRKGFRVLAGCLTQKGADNLQRTSSASLRATLLDVTSSESIQRAAAWVQAEVGEKGDPGTPAAAEAGAGPRGQHLQRAGAALGQRGRLLRLQVHGGGLFRQPAVSPPHPAPFPAPFPVPSPTACGEPPTSCPLPRLSVTQPPSPTPCPSGR
uniref:Retinol dehydrogenase 5 n=1 Tax=Terrapene triunguis TaxID=2587831 RepID=A0A674J734_9SAUR